MGVNSFGNNMEKCGPDVDAPSKEQKEKELEEKKNKKEEAEAPKSRQAGQYYGYSDNVE